MNLNKLFPRLTISAKLAIAFVLLAILPLGLVGVLGTRSALGELRAAARDGLEHDMDLAQTRTARSLREAEQHVRFVADVAALEVLSGPEAGSIREARRIAESYLTSDSSSVFRFKIIDDAGDVRLAVEVEHRAVRVREAPDSEPLYRWTARALDEGDRAILPVELRSSADSGRVVPAVAVVVPVISSGVHLGAVVGEAYAEAIFAGLEAATPGVASGVTGLVDREGHLVYHSERKRDWASLLAGGAGLRLQTEVPEVVAEQVLDGEGGYVRMDDGRDLSYRRVSGDGGPSSLTLYRVLPSSIIDARVRQFLLAFGGLGLVLGLAVLGVSVIAARQITRPIYQLSRAAKLIATGGRPPSLRAETNDEIEDLTRDFNLMAEALAKHRSDLEALVDERTRQLSQTEAHLGQVVTDAVDAILALDADGAITLWNQGAEELFGFEADEVINRGVADVLSPAADAPDDPRTRVGALVMSSELLVNHRTECRGKDGAWIPVTITKSLLHDETGAVIGHSLILRDDRTRELLEEQMRRSERLAAISLMAAGIAHELNNPLSVLGNRVELMQRDARRRNADERLVADLEVLRKHIARIGSVTSDLLRFAREDPDQLVAVDVNSVVGRVARLLNKVFVASGLELETTLESGLPSALGSDSVIETVLVNLLLNAQQATPAGGSVSVVTKRGRTDTTVEIEVEDSGPGIPPESRLRVFEPFFTTKAEQGGTGLGLAVCRTMVDRLGGDIELASGNGRGARFRITLPQDAQATP